MFPVAVHRCPEEVRAGVDAGRVDIVVLGEVAHGDCWRQVPSRVRASAWVSRGREEGVEDERSVETEKEESKAGEEGIILYKRERGDAGGNYTAVPFEDEMV
jgi:hypothetical protein